MAISKLEKYDNTKNKRATDFDEIKLDNLYEKYLSGFAKKFKISSGNTRLDDGSKLTGDKSIAVYLNIINPIRISINCLRNIFHAYIFLCAIL